MKTTISAAHLGCLLMSVVCLIPLNSAFSADPDPSVSATGAVRLQPDNNSNSAAAAQAEPKLPYGVEDVVKLSHAQISDDVVLNYIRNSGTIYTLGPQEIVYLRNQGVSERNCARRRYGLRRRRYPGCARVCRSPELVPGVECLRDSGPNLQLSILLSVLWLLWSLLLWWPCGFVWVWVLWALPWRLLPRWLPWGIPWWIPWRRFAWRCRSWRPWRTSLGWRANNWEGRAPRPQNPPKETTEHV